MHKQKAEEQRSVWLSLESGLSSEARSVLSDQCGHKCVTGEGDSLCPEHQKGTKHPGTKGLARKEGGFRGPGGEGKRVVFQDPSIELLDSAATLWTDFKKTGSWFPLAKD